MVQSGEMPAEELPTGGSQEGGYAGSVGSIALRNRLHHKKNLGGPMHREEIKMNKALLHDISEMKKKLGDRFSSPGQSSGKRALILSPNKMR